MVLEVAPDIAGLVLVLEVELDEIENLEKLSPFEMSLASEFALQESHQVLLGNKMHEIKI